MNTTANHKNHPRTSGDMSPVAPPQAAAPAANAMPVPGPAGFHPPFIPTRATVESVNLPISNCYIQSYGGFEGLRPPCRGALSWWALKPGALTPRDPGGTCRRAYAGRVGLPPTLPLVRPRETAHHRGDLGQNKRAVDGGPEPGSTLQSSPGPAGHPSVTKSVRFASSPMLVIDRRGDRS